jgi:hypothetical protein
MSQVEETQGPGRDCGWHDTGTGCGGKGQVLEVCDEVLGFQEFRIREFNMDELLASRISDISMCDELLLLGASPYRLKHDPNDLSSRDHSQTPIGVSAFAMARCFCSRDS